MLLFALLVGCGGASSAPAPTASSGRFPAAPEDLAALIRQVEAGPVLALTVSRVDPGTRARVAFGLFDAGGRELAAEGAALYVGGRDGRRLRGPFPVARESLEVAPPFRSRTAGDVKRVWVAFVPVPAAASDGVSVVALVRRDGRLERTGASVLRVGGRGPPRPGQRAIRVRTPTERDVDGNLERIDTRVPPWPPLHRADLADVLGRRPVLLLFATPQLCQSRVCGPVVDVAAEVQSRLDDEAAFIHQEIYEGNHVSRGERAPVRAWRLPTEPWAFAIDRRGRVRAALEGAFSARELEAAVRHAVRAR